MTFEDSSLAKSGALSGGANLRFIPPISHMAKMSARGFFANSGGTPNPLKRHTQLMAKRQKITVYAREWRNHFKLTLEDVSAKINLSVSYLSDLEKGHPKKRWNIDHMNALADAFGLDAEDLFRHPKDAGTSLSADDKATAERVITTLLKKTGRAS